MARREPHVVEVGEAQALLDRDRTRVGDVATGRVVGLELDHAGGGEEQGRVAGNERGRRHDRMAARRKEIEERAPEVGCGVDGRGLRGAHPLSRDRGRPGLAGRSRARTQGRAGEDSDCGGGLHGGRASWPGGARASAGSPVEAVVYGITSSAAERPDCAPGAVQTGLPSVIHPARAVVGRRAAPSRSRGRRRR